MSPIDKKRPGSGKDTPVGSGKGTTLGTTQPGSDSSAVPGTPGEVIFDDEPIEINAGRPVITLRVVNTGDRPITVGSHYHFAEVNPALEFDRKAAWGYRQDIIAGGLTRFNPGEPLDVELVPFVGSRIAMGFRGECGGPLDG